jgi:hypothetical protein
MASKEDSDWRHNLFKEGWYVGLVVCSVVNGTMNTSTFSNVQITGGNGGAPVVTPAAPAAFLAAGVRMPSRCAGSRPPGPPATRSSAPPPAEEPTRPWPRASQDRGERHDL